MTRRRKTLPVQDRDELGRFLGAIRGTRGKVIMTSRSQEAWLESMQFELPLRGLEGEERWEYCETIVRELRLREHLKDPALKELMDQLAGHPLAMRVVLPRLERMTATKVSEALRTNIAELGLSEHEEHVRLFATLRFVEQGLPEQLRPLMGLIALHEGYLSAVLLEGMAKQVEPDWMRQRIDQLLAALANAGLVRDVRGMYEIHPLLTSYLRSGREAPEACQRAFVDVMVSLANQLTPLQYHEQRVPFSLHGANFHFALHLSQRLAMEQHLALLTLSLATYAQNSRNFVEASRLFAELAQHAVARAEWQVEASAYHHLGRIAEEQRGFATAREWYLKSLAILEKQGQLDTAAPTYHQLGRIALEQRDWETAREWYLKSLAIEEKRGDPEGVASSYYQLGRMAEDQKDFATARECYLKSLAISEKHGILHGAAMTYHELGRVADQQGDFVTARDWYLRSIAISEKQGILQYAAATHHQLGMVADHQKDFTMAREWYLKSLGISEQQGDLHAAASTYGQLGIVAAKQGNFEDSGKWFTRCITVLQQTQNEHAVEGNVRNFLTVYQKASPDEKEKLKAIWLEAGLGPFPEMNESDDEH